MNIPNHFKQKVIGAFGHDGKQWLETLEERVQTYVTKWKLTNTMPVSNLSYNYVLKALDAEGNPVILKLGVPNEEYTNEINAIRAYEGNRFAALYKAEEENGVMLIEQIMPGTMLTEVSDEDKVIDHYIEVYRALRRPKPDSSNIPSIKDWFKALERYRDEKNEQSISLEHVNLALLYVKEIISSSTNSHLLHGDLHHQNILYSDKNGWMAIDPKGVVGDNYFEFFSFLSNQLMNKPNPKALLAHRIDTLCEKLDLSKVKLLKASYAMAILSTCWAISDDDHAWKEMLTCATYFLSLLEEINQ